MEMEHSMQLTGASEDGEPRAKKTKEDVPDVRLFWRELISDKEAYTAAESRHTHYIFYDLFPKLPKIIITRGQSNLTKSASRRANSRVRGHPRGSKVVPLNAWGRVSYYCSIVTIGLGCTVWPQCTRVTTNDVTTQPISISASFTKVKWGA